MATKPPEARDSWDESDQEPDTWLDIPDFPGDEWRKARYAHLEWPRDLFPEQDWEAVVRDALDNIRNAARGIFASEADLWSACKRHLTNVKRNAELDAESWIESDDEAHFAFSYYDVLWQLRQLAKHAQRGDKQLVAALASALWMVTNLLDNTPSLRRAREEQGRRAAQGRIAKDPRSAAKVQARAYWERWVDDGSLYAGKAEFARDMLDKLPALKNQAVIEGWCRGWERETGRKPSSS
jgi:hypothetical protein